MSIEKDDIMLEKIKNASKKKKLIAVVLILIAIIAIVFACLVNKKTKLSGIVMIITGVGLFLCNFFNIISTILLLIAGIMSLVRKNEKIEA